MQVGALTPEDLEALFEDAWIVRDAAMLGHLFEEGGVLAAGSGQPEARGEQIAGVAEAFWAREQIYVADVRRVLQARDTALSIGRGISVLRRGPDRAWRYAIALLDNDHTTSGRERR